MHHLRMACEQVNLHTGQLPVINFLFTHCSHHFGPLGSASRKDAARSM